MRQDVIIEGFSERYGDGVHVGWHSHDAVQIAFATAGVMRIQTRGGIWTLPPGRALLIPLEVEHMIDCMGTVLMRTVYIRGETSISWQPFAVLNVSPLLRELIVRFCCTPEEGSIASMTELLFREVACSHSLDLELPLPVQPKLRRICELLLDLPDAERTEKAAAMLAAMSERTFVRQFKAATGLDFRQWRLRARLLQALAQIVVGESVSTAAFASGYRSASAFSAAFRKVFGTIPSTYSRQG